MRSMTHYWYAISLILGIPALTFVYSVLEFETGADRIFLTISTFLFSIFTGFFISRQASRFNRIRETVTAFDGNISSIYRTSAHVNSELQTAIGEIALRHYKKIMSSGIWHVHFTGKSSTISEMHQALDAHIKDDEVTKLANQAIGVITKSLAGCQDVRKRMVALYAEKIPHEQWILIIFFAFILIITVSTLPSAGFIFSSLLKAAFVASIFSVLLILYRLNNLIYTEKIMGEKSAQDVIDIIEGKK